MEKRARKRLHVSNIPYELKKADLIELFSNMGPVLDCELINDKTTGKFKGSAKIEFPDYYSVKAALRNLNRYEIKGRFLKLNFANSDKFPSDKSEMIINEDEFSDPEDFETKNAEKDISEVVTGLESNHKLFLLQGLKHLCDTNEEELRNLLRQDEKMAETILSIQRELKFDRGQQNPNRSYFEEEAARNNPHGGGVYRSMNKIGGNQIHPMPGNLGTYGNRRGGIGGGGGVHPKNQGIRRPVTGRDSIGKMPYNQGGMPPNRMNPNYMNFEDGNMNMGMGGMPAMRGNEGPPYHPGNDFGDGRQFNPNMGQPNNMNKNKMFYNSNNRMYNS